MSRVWIISGKGGTGKSSLAPALALQLSRQQKRVLLVELATDTLSPFSWWSHGLSFKPQHLRGSIEGVRWTVRDCLKDFFKHYVKSQKLVELFFNYQPIEQVVEVTPTLKEIALIGRITGHLRQVGTPMNYDAVVVDAFSTGHFKNLIQVPFAITNTIKFGPLYQHCKEIHNILQTPELFTPILATIPEDMSVEETLELNAMLTSEFHQKPFVALNKCLNIPQEALNKEHQSPTGFTEFLKNRQELQNQALERLKFLKPWQLHFHAKEGWELAEALGDEFQKYFEDLKL